MGNYNKQVKINDRKKVAVTAFKGKVWIHFRDELRAKTLSFSKDDFLNFLERLSKIQNSIIECEKSMRKAKKAKPAVDSDADMPSAFADESDSN